MRSMNVESGPRYGRVAQLPAGARDPSLLQSAQTGSRIYPGSHPFNGKDVPFPKSKKLSTRI
jgi:hypothetical protein